MTGTRRPAVPTTGGAAGLAAMTVLTIGLLAGCSSSGAPAAAPTTASPLGSATADPQAPGGLASGAPESPGSDDRGAPSRPAPPPAQAATTAAAFAGAWIRSDLPADRWYAGVAPLCEAGFAKQLRNTDPANIPATTILGPPIAASPPAGGLAVYRVATDTGTLSVTVAVIAGKWLVTNNDFVRATR